MTTTNDLLDRMAEALRSMCQINEIAFNLGFGRPDQDGPYPTSMKVLAEYDRLRASATPADEKQWHEMRADMDKRAMFGSGPNLSTDEWMLVRSLASRGARIPQHSDAGSAVAPVAFGIRSDTGGWFDKIAPTGWTTFDYERSKMEKEPWVINGKATIEPLYARPAPTVATREAVSDALIEAVLTAGHIWDMSMDSARATRGDRLDFIRASVARALAAPPTDRAGDEG